MTQEHRKIEPTCPACEGTRVQDQDFIALKPCTMCNGRGVITQHVHLRKFFKAA